MAKARPVELDPGEPFADAAARVVRVRSEEVFDHAEGVLDTTEIERVHAMRVATRRLRALLEIFRPCFPGAEHQAVLRDVKELARALGERRDPDVHLDAFADRPGIEPLIEHLRERQARGNEVLAAALAEAERGRLRERLLRLPTDNGEGTLGENLERLGRKRLEKLHSYMPGALADEEALHEMRIAAKRLRYVLELTDADGAREVATLQELLGEIHDCDVQVPVVVSVLERSPDHQVGLLRLIVDLHSRRTAAWREFVSAWERFAVGTLARA